MPIIQISLVEGRDPKAIQQCVKAVARVVHESLGAPLSTVRVIVHQIPPAFWGVGDQTRDEIDAERKCSAIDESLKRNP